MKRAHLRASSRSSPAELCWRRVVCCRAARQPCWAGWRRNWRLSESSSALRNSAQRRRPFSASAAAARGEDMPVYSLDGLVPVVDSTSFVHPTATLIGDVIVGPGCYIGPGAALRGDFGRIVVGAGSNVQDNCVLHTFPARQVTLEEESHIGHAAVLHGCIVRHAALVGIGAIVMDDAVVGQQALVGAGSFIRAGFVVPARMLVAGSPARIVRELSAEELEWKATGTR